MIKIVPKFEHMGGFFVSCKISKNRYTTVVSMTYDVIRYIAVSPLHYIAII